MKLITALMFTVTLATAQDTSLSGILGDGQYAADSLAQISLLTARSLEGKVYLHWNASNQHSDGLYIVYRSEDRETFYVVGQKRGVGTPYCMELAYYFTDEAAGPGTVYYRILHLSKEQTYVVSDIISVTTVPRTTLTATKP